MKTKIRLIAILLFISQLVIAQESLNQYLETAANNNTALKSVFNEYMAALEKVAQVGVLQNPQLVFGYFILPVETKNGPQQAKISASQLFPWIGTLKSKEDIFTHSAKAKYSAFEEAKSKLFFDVKSSYFNLFYIQKSIDIALENIRILKSIKNIALIKISAGKASAADEIKTEIELANLENSIALLKDNFSVKSISFNNLLNIDKNSTILIPDSLWINNLSLSKQAILDSMQLNNYQLQSFDHNLEKFLSQEKFSKKEGKPTILLGIDYTSIGDNGLSEQSGKDALLIKIGISVPLYRKKYSALQNEAVLYQQITLNKKENKTNMLETLIEQTLSEYKDANRRIKLFQKQSQLAKKALKILEAEYSSNGKNFEELLKINKSLLQYSLELQKAKADKLTAIAFIEYLMGK